MKVLASGRPDAIIEIEPEEVSGDLQIVFIFYLSFIDFFYSYTKILIYVFSIFKILNIFKKILVIFSLTFSFKDSLFSNDT